MFLFLPLASSLAFAEEGKVIRDLEKTKIIRSREEPHNILTEACIACHPKETFEFWLLIYKGREPSLSVELPGRKTAAEEPGKAAAESAKAPATPANPFNSHDAIGCNFCHFANPTKETPNFIVGIQDLCRLCHPQTGLHHLPEGEGKGRVAAAIAKGTLPGSEAGPLCTSCHQLHDSTFGMREAYARTIWEKRIPDPHADRSLCSVCHPGTMKRKDDMTLAKGGDINLLCNDCHLRQGIKPSPHVVDVGSSESTWRMDYLGYPLKEGKLTCSTCHDEVCYGRPDPANRSFLRGGPYENADRFCYRCHLEDTAALNNPHSQLDAFGRIREESCRFCHKNSPDRDRRTDANLEMVGEETTICGSCHQIRPHPATNHLVPLQGEKLRRLEEYRERHRVSMPLDSAGAVKCTTCHNPHGKGVLKGEAGAGAGSLWRVPDFREMCAPCHGRY